MPNAVELPYDHAYLFIVQRAGLGQAVMARRAVEEPHAHRLLKRAHLAGD